MQSTALPIITTLRSSGLFNVWTYYLLVMRANQNVLALLSYLPYQNKPMLVMYIKVW